MLWLLLSLMFRFLKIDAGEQSVVKNKKPLFNTLPFASVHAIDINNPLNWLF
jgi:hypothetical protein